MGRTRGFIGDLPGSDLHAKRADALAPATLGVMAGASLAVSMTSQALAQARGLVTKPAVKQVDRLTGNAGTGVWDGFARWVPQQAGAQPGIPVAMHWTGFDHDGQSTLVLSLVTGHGQAAPLTRRSVGRDGISEPGRDKCYNRPAIRRQFVTVPGIGMTLQAGGIMTFTDFWRKPPNQPSGTPAFPRVRRHVSALATSVLLAAALAGCGCRPGCIGPYGGIHPERYWIG